MREGSVEQWVECNPVSTCWLRTLCNLGCSIMQCIGQIAATVQASTPPPTSCSSRHSCRHPFSLCHASILHAPLPASISPRNAHCKLQTIAHSLSVHMCVSPCACVRVCVFPCRMPIVCARMDFCRWTEWIAATVQASIDDNGKLAHLEAQLPPSFLALLVCGQHAACLTVALSSRGRWVGGSCG